MQNDLAQVFGWLVDDEHMWVRRRYHIWLGYWAIVAALTHLPPSHTSRLSGAFRDDVLHLLLFMLLSLLGAWALHLQKISWGCMLGISLIGYAALDEITQAWVGRTPDLKDWMADTFGIALGVALYLGYVILRARSGRGASRFGSQCGCSAWRPYDSPDA